MYVPVDDRRGFRRYIIGTTSSRAGTPTMPEFLQVFVNRGTLVAKTYLPGILPYFKEVPYV